MTDDTEQGLTDADVRRRPRARFVSASLGSTGAGSAAGRQAARFVAVVLTLCLLPGPAPADEGDGETPAPAEAGTDAGTPSPDPAPASDPAPDAEPEPALEPMPDEQFDLQVRGLEERVTDLKERIFQTKARLMLLQETVIGGDLSSGARAVLVHRNEMGASFVLESVTYILDGAPIFTRVDQDGELDRQKEIEIFNGRIVPGTHQIGVRLVYRGSGYGVFSYLNDYRFRVQSSYTFNAEGGTVTRVEIVSFERGGLTTDLEDRPAVRYEEEVTRDAPGARTRAAQAEDGR